MKRPNDPSYRVYAPWVIIAVALPLVAHILYRFPAPHPLVESVWGVGELLDYAGSILGAFATIVALRWTIKEERNGRLEEQRLSAIPCIALTCLERKLANDGSFSVAGETNLETDDEANGYREYELEREYITVTSGAIKYQTALTDVQKRLASGSGWDELARGVCAFVGNSSCYFPIVLHSTGNGPAINVSLRLEKDGECPRFEYDGSPLQTSPKQMLIGVKRYIGILIEDYTDEESIGDYEIVIGFQDTLGNHYEQRHALRVKRGEAFGMEVKNCWSLDLKVDARLV